MATDPILSFGRVVPADLREWDRVLSRINTVVRVDMSSGTPIYIISEQTEFPSVPTIIDAARAFLPHPQMPPAPPEAEVMTHRVFAVPQRSETPIEAHMMAIEAFRKPEPAQRTIDNSELILVNQIFGAH